MTTRTTVGGELTGGGGHADGDDADRHWLLAIRGYGRGTPRTRDWVALTYGAGLSVMDVGLVTLTAHGGGAISYPNDDAAPFLGVGLAAAIPLHKGACGGASRSARHASGARSTSIRAQPTRPPRSARPVLVR